MRTTIPIEPDVEALLKQSMRGRGVTFKDAVNQAVRAGLAKPAEDARPLRRRSFHMGKPRVDLTKALGDERDDLAYRWVPSK